MISELASELEVYENVVREGGQINEGFYGEDVQLCKNYPFGRREKL